MGDAGFPESHTTTTGAATTGVYASTGKPHLDLQYIKELPGILKAVQIGLSFLTFCICVSAPDFSGKAGWAGFVSFFGFLIPIILLICYLLHIVDLIPRLPWPLIELVYYVLWTLFFLIAAICMAVLAAYPWSNTGVSAAGSFFCFLCTFLFGFDAFLKFKKWRDSVGQGRQESTQPQPQPQYAQP